LSIARALSTRKNPLLLLAVLLQFELKLQSEIITDDLDSYPTLGLELK